MPSSRTATPKPAKLPVVTADSFAGIQWLRHGFSTRKGGVSKCYGGKSLNLGVTEDDTREAVQQIAVQATTGAEIDVPPTGP